MASVVRRTKLYDFHLAKKGKLVPFADHWLPVQFPMGVLNEHFYTRQKCGLFDVSHMGQVRFFGKDREKFVEFATVADVQGLAPRTGRLSLIPNENGGVVDDCMVHRFEDHVYIVINGACVAKDLAHFEKLRKQMGGDVHMKFETDVTLVAIQGPLAQKVMSQWVPNLEKMAYMSGTDTTIDGIPVHMTRCGYTGEDGFEISVSNKHAMQLAELLTTNTEVEPHRPLVARDSLRLECGMCLYGHELSMTTSPVSAKPHVAVLEAPPAARRVPGLQEDQGGVRQQGGPGPHSARRCDFPWTVRSRAHEGVSLMASKSVSSAAVATRRAWGTTSRRRTSTCRTPSLGPSSRWMSAARRWRLKLPSSRLFKRTTTSCEPCSTRP